MQKKEVFEIPYRIETKEDITRAQQVNFLNLGSGYGKMLSLEGFAQLKKPQALLQARPCVEKTFYMLREQLRREAVVTFEEIAGLDFIEDFQKIEKAIPDINEITRHATLFPFLESLPETAQKHCRLHQQGSSSCEKIINLRDFLRHEILACSHTGSHRNLSSGEIKKLLAACALFLPENEDVLQALRHARSGDQEQLYQHGLAELLFRRLPAFMEQLVQVETKIIRRRAFEKTAKLGLTPRQRMHLQGYFKAHTRQDDLPAALGRFDQAAKKILEAAVYKKIHGYLLSLEHSIQYVQKVYHEWFLTKELAVMKRLHVPGLVMKSTTSYRDIILKTWSELVTLKFFPAKDFLDLCKYRISEDCTYRDDLAEPQLLCPNFFNIRVFDGGSWTGNIYMLDFTREHGVLLVDRIQIPRDINADYIDFFTYLREAFEELFAAVAYTEIIMPLRISNHQSIQKLFNRYRKRLKRKKLRIASHYAPCFESLQVKEDYVILCLKDEAANNSRQVERS